MMSNIRFVRFFRPEIESVIKMVGVIGFIAMIVLPIAWGYEQRRQARLWQSVACAYRMKEITHRAPIIARVDYAADPCGTLQRLGFMLDAPR